MLLADLGAQVIKVEPPGGGDETRSWSPPELAGQSTYFLAVNRNKQGIVLDLQTPEGRGDLDDLLKDADVLVHNYLPATAHRLGLEAKDLRRSWPRLIVCEISGFGPVGPRREEPGYDFLIQALSGWISVTGPPHGPGYKTGLAVIDVICGLLAANGIQAALASRANTGQGQVVGVNLLESALFGLINQASGYLAAGVVPKPMGNDHPSVAPYATFETADRPLALAVGNQGQFSRLCAALGRPELVTDPRFTSNAQRVAHRDQLRIEIESALGTDDAATWSLRLAEAKVPAGEVKTVASAFADPQVSALGTVRSVEHPGIGAVNMVAPPIHLDDTACSIRLPCPQLGEHTGQLRGADGRLAWP